MSENEFKEVRYKHGGYNHYHTYQRDIVNNEGEVIRKTRPPRFDVTKTGAIALYNLQSTPIVLYPEQWEKLSNLIKRDILSRFIAQNSSRLIYRPQRHQRYQNNSAPTTTTATTTTTTTMPEASEQKNSTADVVDQQNS